MGDINLEKKSLEKVRDDKALTLKFASLGQKDCGNGEPRLEDG